MLEDLYIFVRGITSFKYDVPIPLQVTLYTFIIILLTGIVYIFKDTLDKSALRDHYMWIYVLIILNIINIIIVLTYYYNRKGTFIGSEGEKGELGLRGDVGNNMNCSLCQTNIFMVSTSRYDNITQLNFTELFKTLIDSNISERLDKINNMVNNDYFDFTEFTSNLIQGEFDMKNEITQTLLLLSMYNEYPIINYINESIGLSDDKMTGYFKRPYGKQSYMSLGDSAFGGSKFYETTSFMVNGDIRVPEGFEILCSFVSVKESGELDKYNIFKMIPPKLINIENKDDLIKQNTNDEYVSLGDIVYSNNNDNNNKNGNIDPLLFGCVKKSCCKKIDSKDMKLLFIYPGANPNININNVKGEINMNEGVFSVWKTPLNTIKVKFSNGDFINNVTLLETLYTNGYGIIDSSIYTRDGRIKKKVLGKIEHFLNKLNLNKISIVALLFGFVIESVKRELNRIYRVFIRGSNEINSTPNLNKLKNKDNITLNDISNAIKDLQMVIDINIKEKLEKAERNIKTIKERRIRSLGEVDNPKEFKSSTGVGYQLQKSYEGVKSLIMNLSIQIENSNSVMDIIKIMFPQGLGGKIYTNELSPNQVRLLNIVRVLIPPSDDIYILKNDCLVFEQIDEKRVELSLELEEEINKFKVLRNKINKDAESYCGNGNVERINYMVDKTYDIITNTIGHIPDYLNKLLRGNFNDISTDKLQIILTQLSNLNNYVFKKCNNE